MSNFKILVTGSNGQLGSELKVLAGIYKSYEFVFTDVAELNIADYDIVAEFVKNGKFDFLINCAAYTAVDKAEDEIELCDTINRKGPDSLAMACAAAGTRLVHVSTDYVFDGYYYRPYRETDGMNPIGAYGQSKYDGETLVLASGVAGAIIRTSWLYSTFGNNFVKSMLKFGRERASLNVVFDQVGSPTYAADLAVAILEALPVLSQKDSCEVYHYSNEGVISWYDFTKTIFEMEGITSCKVSPIESKDYPTKARRPHFSVLNKSKFKTDFQTEIPYWKDSLKNCLTKLKSNS